MTIVKSIKKIVPQPARLLSSRESFNAIVGQGLHQSQAKHPNHNVLEQIRRHWFEIDFFTDSLAKNFKILGEYIYTFLEHPIRQFDIIACDIGPPGQNKKRALPEKQKMIFFIFESLRYKLFYGCKFDNSQTTNIFRNLVLL